LTQKGFKVVRHTHRPYLPPTKYSLCSFLLEAQKATEHNEAWRIKVM